MTRKLFETAECGPVEIGQTMRIEVDHQSQTISSQSAADIVSILDEQFSSTHNGETIVKDAPDAGAREESSSRTGAFVKPDPPYSFITRIGVGGMGEIWRAEQKALRRTIAIKVIRNKDDVEKMRRAEIAFLKEALITGSLQHPNIMPVHDIHLSHDGKLMLVMQEISGVPWSHLLHPYREPDTRKRELLTARAERTTLRQHIAYLMSVCDAISYAHSKGYIHRDIKPEQVMIGDYGEVILLDWGLAIPIAEAANGVNSICGTPAYLAPEMTAVPGAVLTVRTDVYLLGAMLYEILTLQPPHKAEDAYKCIFKASTGNVVQPEVLRPGALIPAELARLAMWALRPYPEHRPETAAEFRRHLQEFLTWRAGELDQKDGFYEIRHGSQPAQERDILVKTIADFEGRFQISDLKDSDRDAKNRKNQSMLTEARILRRLSHPNMPVLYDVDIDGDGRPTLLLRPYPGKNLGSLMRPHPMYGDWAIRNQLNPYIEGQPPDVVAKYTRIFDDWLAGPFLDLETLLDVFLTVADVLLYVHQHHIAHRHLRPPCVYADDFGVVTLTDWGYAVDIRDQPEPPFLATPREEARERLPPYSAPEVLNEKWSQITDRTDVYGLAGLLFQGLCGLPPHWPKDEEPKDHIALMAFGQRGQITAPIDFAPEGWNVPRELSDLAMEGLAFNPGKRPTMRVFRDRLRRAARSLG